MNYNYLGYNEDKQVVKGTVSASSEAAAGQLLAHDGYRVLSLKPVATFTPNWEQLFPSLYRVKPASIIMLSRQLALLLESGIDIVTSLELLRGQESNRTLRRVLGEIVSDLRSGHRLSAALDRHPEIFPPVYRRSLSVGEQTGGLETVLRQVADHMERENTTAKEVKGALRYPAIVAVVAVIVIGVLVTFVLPAFTDLYSSLGAELPLLTRMLLDAVDGLQQYGLYLVAAAAGIIVAALTYVKTPAGKYQWHRLLLRLPLMGRVIQLDELARCCRNMSLLFRAGLPLPEIMSLVVQGSNNRVLAKALSDVREDMLKGEGMSQPMAKNPVFLPLMVQMAKVGEETGNLDDTLLSVAQGFEIEAEDKTQSLVGLIQPAMTLIIGLIVAFIALSMMSAMYSVYGQMA
ncbi:MAG: type II secretion system F family protein [Chloroflexota bacterium]|nr:type II secretion system F family protein [Chloroflexota bacterium]